MKRTARAALMIFLGLVGTRLVVTGEFGQFLQQRMRLPLLVASIVLLVLGLVEGRAVLLSEPDGDDDHEHDDDDHHPAHSPFVGWLLVLPVVALFAVAPSALGAAASDRVPPITPLDTHTDFEPLDASGGPVEMRVWDFLDRAIWDEDRSLADVPVRLEGLVVNDVLLPDGFLLTKFVVNCCAADGTPIQVAVRNTGSFLADDTWVKVDVEWRPPTEPYDRDDGPIVVEADALEVTVVPDPPNGPYESPY